MRLLISALYIWKVPGENNHMPNEKEVGWTLRKWPSASAHVAIHQSFSLYSCCRSAAAAAAAGILLRLWLLFELTTHASAAQVRAWRRHYVLIIIFNYLLRTTRACRNSESWTRTTLHCADCFSFCTLALAFIYTLVTSRSFARAHQEPAQ